MPLVATWASACVCSVSPANDDFDGGYITAIELRRTACSCCNRFVTEARVLTSSRILDSKAVDGLKVTLII